MTLLTSAPECRTELTAIRHSVRTFVDREIRPTVEEWEQRQRFPRQLMPRMGELGYFGAAFPEEVGGSATGRLPQCVIVEELARATGGISTVCLVQVLSLLPIALHGTLEHKERYVRPGLLGEKVACIAITEPSHGSDVSGIETTATIDGNGFRISGSKMFITRWTSETAPVYLDDCRVPASALVVPSSRRCGIVLRGWRQTWQRVAPCSTRPSKTQIRPSRTG
jgi:alkylation response protein AidB-like acyl-CoA dehydrogenase